jgi:hypothetical protein
MNRKNFILVMVLTLLIVPGAFTGSVASGNVEWNVYRTLQLEATPIDVAVSPDGRRLFVLTDRGEVVIYSSTGPSAGKIEAKSRPQGDFAGFEQQQEQNRSDCYP